MSGERESVIDLLKGAVNKVDQAQRRMDSARLQDAHDLLNEVLDDLI